MAMKKRLMWQHQYSKEAILPNCYTKVYLDNQLIHFYKQWKNKYLQVYKEGNGPSYYLFANLERYSVYTPTVTTSEAMGYGLLVTIFMNRYDYEAKKVFDGLYRMVKSYPSAGCEGLMASAQQQLAGGKIVPHLHKIYACTGAELDIAYALILAHKLWGTEGEIDYAKEAKGRLDAIMTHCIDQGDWSVGVEDWMQDAMRKGQVVRTADLMLEHFREFVLFDLSNSMKWMKVLKAAKEVIHKQQRRAAVGLLPEYLVKVGHAYEVPVDKVYKSSRDGTYFYEACTLPFRYGIDIVLNGHGAGSQVRRMNRWIRKETKEQPKNIMAGYYVTGDRSGEAFGKSGELAFIAPFMASACGGRSNQRWLNELWCYLERTPISKSDFLGNTMKLLAMIVASGNWYI